MKTSTIVWVLIILAVLVGGWYWMSGTKYAATPATPSADSTETQTPPAENTQSPVTTTTTTTTTTTSTAILNINLDSKLKQYLASAKGMALYTYSKDTPGVSNCSGTCAVNWPPYTVAAGTTLSAAIGITGTAVSTITRADGTTQVTYKGMPLYLWTQDAKPGDVTGNNVGGFLTAKP